MTEQKLQEKIIFLFRSHGMLCFTWQSSSSRGVPDLIVQYGGLTRFLELKHPNGRGRLSTLQKHTIAQLRAQGAQVDVINSTEEAEQIIAELIDAGTKRGD